MNKYIIELIGTFFLVLTVAFTGNPLAIGAVLTALVYMGGYISGAHYNPAVTLAVFIRGKITKEETRKYIFFQVVGAILAALLYNFIKGSFFVPQPASGYGQVEVIIVEMLFTFLLAFVVLHTTTSAKSKDYQYYGMAIGFTLLAGAFAAGPISGGVFNPAIALGTILVNIPQISANLGNLAVYLIGPLTGGLLAGLIYKNLYS